MYIRLACRGPLIQKRCFAAASSQIDTANVAARWLTDLRARIGRCIIFGLRPAQVDEAGSVLRAITREWRELLAGSEGFLVGRGRAGLEGHQVVWGEMVGHLTSKYQRIFLEQSLMPFM